MKKIQWPRLLAALLLPLAVGGLSAWLTGSFSEAYRSVYKPLLSPPGWVFPVVWTALYLLMGYASYLVWTSDAPDGEKKGALTLYAVQLFFNFVWPLLFFRWRLFWIAFIWLVLLWVLIAGAKEAPITRQLIALVVAAVAKFLTLYLVIVQWLVPMVLTLNEKQTAVLSASFSFPQLITAAIGGVLALLLVPPLRRALKV